MSSDDNRELEYSNKINLDEIGFILPLITGGIYISLSLYFQMYFRTIGIEQNLLNLNLDFYLINGILPISVVLITFFLFMTGTSVDPQYKYWGEVLFAFISIITIYICLVIAIYWMFFLDNSGFFFNIFFVSVSIILLFFYLIVSFSYPFLSCFNVFTDNFLLRKMMAIIIFFGLCGFFSIALGVYQGNQFVNGETSDAVQVHFKFVNETTQHFSNEIENETFLLITYRENCYYVTPLNKSKIKHNNVYILPDQEVISARLERIH